KLHGRPYRSEVPYAAPERVPPAPPIADLSRARIAMVTTGGLVRKGNPDKQVSANAVRYHRHTVSELESLSPTDWEAYHAGYFNHIVNSNPNYILPLSFLRDLERQGRVGKVHEHIYALPGVSTPVAVSAGHGRSIAADLKAGGVDGALLVARTEALRADGDLSTWGPRHGPQAPTRSARPGKAVARLYNPGEERRMRLEMGTFPVSDVVFGRATRYDAGRLTVDRDAVLSA